MFDYKGERFDIIIQAGQSNAWGCGFEPMPELFADNDKSFFLNDDMSVVKADCHEFDGIKFGDLSLSFAQKYAKNDLQIGRKLLIIRSAVGGTGFSDNRWNETDDLFLQMIKMTKTALSFNPENRVIMLLWHQGETDACLNASYENHYKNLSRLIELVKNEFNSPALPFIMGDFVFDWKKEHMEICEPVVNAIKDVCTNFGGSFVETSDLKSNREKSGIDDGDNNKIHFCNESLYLLGLRYYEAYVRNQKYDIIIQAGQSNAEGWGVIVSPELFTTNSFHRYYLFDGSIVPAAGWMNCGVHMGEFSYSFAQKYAENDLKSDRKILTIRSAVGGTGFHDNRWTVTGDLYPQMIRMIKEALALNPENRLVALLWHQGESECNVWDSKTHYEHLNNLVELVRKEFNVPDLPFVAGDFIEDWKIREARDYAPIVEAIKGVCANVGGAFVETDGLESNRENLKRINYVPPEGFDMREDIIHFCDKALNKLGQRYYDAYKSILNK